MTWRPVAGIPGIPSSLDFELQIPYLCNRGTSGSVPAGFVIAMFQFFTLWVGVLLVLIVYLCLSVGLRWRTQWLRERHFPTTGFDASAIAPQVQRVRQDHLAALKCWPQDGSHRARLIAAARRLVTSFSYFCRARSHPEFQKHDS